MKRKILCVIFSLTLIFSASLLMAFSQQRNSLELTDSTITDGLKEINSDGELSDEEKVTQILDLLFSLKELNLITNDQENNIDFGLFFAYENNGADRVYDGRYFNDKQIFLKAREGRGDVDLDTISITTEIKEISKHGNRIDIRLYESFEFFYFKAESDSGFYDYYDISLIYNEADGWLIESLLANDEIDGSFYKQYSDVSEMLESIRPLSQKVLNRINEPEPPTVTPLPDDEIARLRTPPSAEPITAFNFSKSTLSVERETQAKTNWGWAAAAEMIGAYVKGDLIYDQWDIVKEIKGSYLNGGASVSETVNAINFALDGNAAYTYGGVLSLAEHKSQIDNHCPVGAEISFDGGGAHMLVCIGMASSGDTHYLQMLDPREDFQSEWINYTDAKNGLSLQTGTFSYAASLYED